MKCYLIAVALLVASFNTQAEMPSTVTTALKNAGIPQQNVAIYVQAVEGKSPLLSLECG